MPSSGRTTVRRIDVAALTARGRLLVYGAASGEATTRAGRAGQLTRGRDESEVRRTFAIAAPTRTLSSEKVSEARAGASWTSAATEWT